MPDRPRLKLERPARIGDASVERAAREWERLRREWGDFLAALAWCHFATLTLEQPCSPERLRRLFLDEWVRRLAQVAQTSTPWFYAIEVSAGGWPHVHALVAGTSGLQTARLQVAWDRGHTRVRVYDPSLGAPYYVTKEIGRTCELYDLSRRPPPLLRRAA